MAERSFGTRYVTIVRLSAAVLLWAISGTGLAQEEGIITGGKIEFERRCVICHGSGAKGDGSMASELQTKPADLTQLSKKNEGKFPFWYVYRTTDGREVMKGHGTREMPIWGADFLVEAGPGTRDIEAEVSGRILTLVYYLRSVQEK